MQLWRGRLHFIGGAAEDRWTPTSDHWSIAVHEGVASDATWRVERPVPIPGMHRPSAVVNDALYVFGGQQGDFQAIPGDPDCRCTGRTQETYLHEAFRLDEPSGSWRRIADLPVAASHTDYSTVVVGHLVLLLGGQIFKHPEEFYLRLTDAIQAYDTVTDRWSVLGHLPHPLKIPVAGALGNQLFVVGGQRGALPDGDRPGGIVNDTLRATLRSRHSHPSW